MKLFRIREYPGLSKLNFNLLKKTDFDFSGHISNPVPMRSLEMHLNTAEEL